ncbi:MAG TPA: VWA domain-containing protein [Gemmataceae bacterium]|nr:VWA domain-containing protein [Gemmataceae bacterium]
MFDALREHLSRLGGYLSQLGTALEGMVARLAYPAALWLLAVIPVLWVVSIVAWYRRRRALRRLGSGLALRTLTSTHGRWRSLRSLCWSTGITALVLGIAGPRWGIDPAQQAASGRDLVVVLDLSRSMLAEQPSRQERARRALFDLAASLLRRGGHRVALVVFAGRAKLVCPLTHDYDHFRDAVLLADADNLSLDLRPLADGTGSGTRIGSALRLAVAAHDKSLTGYQGILLVSDGDDPGGDEEWADGAEQARLRGIPVYCLGVGDPAGPGSEIPTPEGPLVYNGKTIQTRLEERPLREIAARSGGAYLPARTRPLPQGSLYRAVLEEQARHANRDVPLPLYRPRYGWFFGTALALFAVALLLGGPARRTAQRSELERQRGTGKTAGINPAAR